MQPIHNFRFLCISLVNEHRLDVSGEIFKHGYGKDSMLFKHALEQNGDLVVLLEVKNWRT